jgi:hypothetical protein
MLRLVCFSLNFTLIWKLVINSWRFTGCCLLLKYDVYLFLSVSSRHSRSLAEDAFFHPSIMSISYYSFEHCFAIYSVRPLTLLLAINTTIYNVTFLTIPSYWPDYIYILTFIIREYRLCKFFLEHIIHVYFDKIFIIKENWILRKWKSYGCLLILICSTMLPAIFSACYNAYSPRRLTRMEKIQARK